VGTTVELPAFHFIYHFPISGILAHHWNHLRWIIASRRTLRAYDEGDCRHDGVEQGRASRKRAIE